MGIVKTIALWALFALIAATITVCTGLNTVGAVLVGVPFGVVPVVIAQYRGWILSD